MTQSFIEDMKPFIQKAWEKSAFAQPTTVQAEAVPLALEGRDIIAESPTGTGKTLAYLLPILENIDPDKQAVQAVILASSQELVMQILSEIQKWAEGSGIKAASFIGGANVKRQLEKLKKHPHIALGTPGRVLELIKQKKLKMHEVKTVVLDEGDQLLVPEHAQTVQNIVKSTLKERQVLLFSATLPPVVEQLAKALTADAEVIRVEKDETIQAAGVDHIYFVAEARDKIKMLEKISRLEDIKALVFVKDIGNLTVMAEKLDFKNISSSTLHSDLSKFDRQKAIKNFRTGKTNMLIATDVAARGLDIKGVTHVVHFDFPKDMNQYVHRSGRTGRFGASGTVISLVTEREERELKKMVKELGHTAEKKVMRGGHIV
ncbi:DEAD/DEAH box helicase [Cytobacillus firmus]|uniref:DEAD/DEAH box helicase n=1 Tax=Cytobacillus TaxID=2675230 RepID=UPI001C23EB8C|nr:DEAD/DEAH box helicase [Cytobacillus oceanisediminis]MBU8730065.1 DEAD/DEAH box helicase [Cytobacillus oceanisediminis]MCM3241887.1 DEAD/DEAH box helicase [Cytobacillus oceanisediminis]MCS0824474.1 DEAD/DEAH box helicase [Cytobacillus firmus]